MKPLLIVPLCIMLLLTTESCKKKKSDIPFSTADSMMMRYNGGFTPVADVRVYLLANGIVLEDTSTPPDNIFDIDLGQAKYDQAAYILSEVPGELLNENGKQYGTDKYPDAGGVQLTAHIKGVAYTWYFSDYTDEMPAYARAFADKLFSVEQTFKN